MTFYTALGSIVGTMKIQLKNWAVASKGKDQYTPPELWVPVLVGNTYGHPKFPEGHEITTSHIKGKRDGCVVTHSGSEYELLDIDPNYEKLYPDAREKLFSTLPDV